MVGALFESLGAIANVCVVVVAVWLMYAIFASMFITQNLNATKMEDLGYATCKTLITFFWLCSPFLM